MTYELLDNPFWSSLTTRHHAIALGTDDVRRYPRDVAPFVGVPHADVTIDDTLDTLVAPDETALMLGVTPTGLTRWQLERLEPITQMVREAPLPVPDGPEIVPLLSEAQHADALALTALVYPHYFRARTFELGRYFGIYVDGRLAAMAGERFGTPAHREVSAVCAHPDFSGRGHARRLTAWLVNDILEGGLVPFLHVANANERARTLYERTGWTARRELLLWKLSPVAR